MDVSVWPVWLQADRGTEQMAVLDFMRPSATCFSSVGRCAALAQGALSHTQFKGVVLVHASSKQQAASCKHSRSHRLRGHSDGEGLPCVSWDQ